MIGRRKPVAPSDTAKLLQASIDMVTMQNRIDTLEAENQLLRARLRIADLKLNRARGDLPALLRPQAG